jgi:hypothetical protein
MAVTPTRLCSTFIPTGVDSLYTVGTSTVARVDAMALTNTDSSVRIVSIYLVAAGGAPDASNVVMSAAQIAPGQTLRVTGAIGQVLRAGGTIQAVCDGANAVNIYASGVEIA